MARHSCPLEPLCRGKVTHLKKKGFVDMVRKDEELGGYICSEAVSGTGTPRTEWFTGFEREGASEIPRPVGGWGEGRAQGALPGLGTPAEPEQVDGPAELHPWLRS